MENLFKTQNCTWSNTIKLFIFLNFKIRLFPIFVLIKYFNKQIWEEKKTYNKESLLNFTHVNLILVRSFFFNVVVAIVCCVLIPKLFRLFYLHSIGLCWMLPFYFNMYDLLKSFSSDSKLVSISLYIDIPRVVIFFFTDKRRTFHLYMFFFSLVNSRNKFLSDSCFFYFFLFFKTCLVFFL